QPDYGGTAPNPATKYAVASVDYSAKLPNVGVETSTYEAYDGRGHSASATVTVDVRDASYDTAPMCFDDSFTIEAGTTVPLFAECMDNEDDQVSMVVVGQPAHGTIGTDADGNPTYTPAADFTGSDTLTYKGSDGTM